MEVRLYGLLTKWHPERLLRKAICSILHRFAFLMPTLVCWLGDSKNYHILRTWILFWKIFRISDNSPAVWLFRDIVIVFFSLSMIIFAIILAKKKGIKLKYTKKSSLFCYFMKTFFELNIVWWYSTWKVFNMKNSRISELLTTDWYWLLYL